MIIEQDHSVRSLCGALPLQLHEAARAGRCAAACRDAAPERTFIARAELATAAHDWTPQEAQACPGDSTGGVLLTQIDEWEPPVSMSTVLAEIGPGGDAKADFETGVVQISAREYEAALAVQAAAQ